MELILSSCLVGLRFCLRAALPPIDKVIAFEGAVPRLVELAKHPDHTVKVRVWALVTAMLETQIVVRWERWERGLAMRN